MIMIMLLFLYLFVFVCSGFCFFFFKQKTAYEMLRSLVGSEMCIRDRDRPEAWQQHLHNNVGCRGKLPPVLRKPDRRCPATLSRQGPSLKAITLALTGAHPQDRRSTLLHTGAGRGTASHGRRADTFISAAARPRQLLQVFHRRETGWGVVPRTVWDGLRPAGTACQHSEDFFDGAHRDAIHDPGREPSSRGSC
eukprot:TRINITY_DN6408_c0_g1_i1.p1 TRINITY_DN6408_c0_g1~~TRINITY_DN6408_c0_g1_i1.p1  ORF type:complete len:194 (+),score=22.08 TRINITY_DN6408_c0_g1_i1:42-623(+)